MSKLYRDNQLTDKRLRRKLDETVDDPDWRTNQWDPGTFLGTVGSIAAGSLTVTITPKDTQRNPTPDPVTVTITTETDNEAAEAVVDAINAALETVSTTTTSREPDLKLYLDRAEYTAATAVVRFVPNPHAPKFSVALSAVGGATFTISPDDIFPITAWSAKQVGGNVAVPGVVAISVHAVTSADVPLAIGTCTFNIDVLRVYERYDPVTHTELRPGVALVASDTGLTLGEELRFSLGGGRFGVRITTDANVPATTEAFEVRWRDVVT